MLHRMQSDIVQGSGEAVRALLEHLQSEQELFASANTLKMVEAHLLVMAQTLAHLSPLLRQQLVQLDWHGWQQLQQVLEQDVQPRHEEVWYALALTGIDPPLLTGIDPAVISSMDLDAA